MTLDQRIRALRAHFGLTQEEFGARVGVSVQSVSQWETPERAGQARRPPRPSKDRLVAIAREFGARQAWLLSNDGPMLEGEENYSVEPDFPPDPEQVKAARKKARRQLEPGELVEVDVIGGLGPGGFAPEIVIDGQVVDNLRATWRVPQDFLHSELRAREIDVEIFPVEGDSMIPTLSAGDRVLVNRRQNMLSQDGLYAISGPTGVQVKRLQYVQGTNDPVRVLVISDNPMHRSPELSLDEIHIIGRVICRISRL